MKFRSFSVALIIILTPFIIGLSLFAVRGSETVYGKARFIADTRKNKGGVNSKGIKVDWTFCPDWEYKPLFLPSEEYLVFMFHYTNNNDYTVTVMPSYTFASGGNRRYSANEEISMYIEDGVEATFGAEDQTSITFGIPPNGTKHYIVTFEKPHSLDSFYVDVDVFRDIKFIQAVETSHGSLFGISFMSLFPSIKIIASVLWGYSLWWLVLVAIIFAHYVKTKAHPFVFGWWAYTFPFEAFTVSTGLLAKCVATGFLHALLITLNLSVVIVWIIVVTGTVRWLESGAFFKPQH